MGFCGSGADQLGDGCIEGRIADRKVDSRRWVESALQFATERDRRLRVETKLFEIDQRIGGFGQEGEDSRLKAVSQNVLAGILVVLFVDI